MPSRTDPPKAYENLDFLNSSSGRTLRILAEYEEPAARFRKHRIKDTAVFFGSARTLPRATTEKRLTQLRGANPKEMNNFADILRHAQQDHDMSAYYEDAVELAAKLTKWSLDLDYADGRFVVCTGGGPGIMEAANKGALEAGGQSIGLGVSLPFEQHLNEYISEDLGFEFHYFFMRKFWFAYLAKALVAFPGGFGTLDEAFEALTLTQTKKIKKPVKLVLYGEKYWREIVNIERLLDHRMIGPEDLDLYAYCSTPDEAFDTLVEHFEKEFL
jgi:uncharacterized protein (TIGR00730 family)